MLSYLFAGAFVNETKNRHPLHISKIYITFQLCHNELIQYQMESSSFFFWLKRYGRYLNYKPGMFFFLFNEPTRSTAVDVSFKKEIQIVESLFLFVDN